MASRRHVYGALCIDVHCVCCATWHTGHPKKMRNRMVQCSKCVLAPPRPDDARKTARVMAHQRRALTWHGHCSGTALKGNSLRSVGLTGPLCHSYAKCRAGRISVRWGGRPRCPRARGPVDWLPWGPVGPWAGCPAGPWARGPVAPWARCPVGPWARGPLLVRREKRHIRLCRRSSSKDTGSARGEKHIKNRKTENRKIE